MTIYIYIYIYIFHEKVTASVQDEKKIVRTLAGLRLRADQLLVARLSSLLGVAVVLLIRSLPSCMPVPCSVFCLLAFELLDDAVSRAGRDEKQTAPEILVCLFPRLLRNGIERRAGIGKRM